MKIKEEDYRRAMRKIGGTLFATSEAFKNAGQVTQNAEFNGSLMPKFAFDDALASVTGWLGEVVPILDALKEVADNWPLEIILPEQGSLPPQGPALQVVPPKQEEAPPPPPAKSAIAQALEDETPDFGGQTDEEPLKSGSGFSLAKMIKENTPTV